MTSPTPRTVLIVGAGFSGSLTAVNLLRQSAGAPLRVVLVNRSGRMARGIAYGTASAEHVLNVPAGNMSALADDPDDFLRYCRWANPQVQPSSFVSRKLYGSYLEALLDAAEHGAQAGASLERVVSEVQRVHLQPGGTGAHAVLADGRVLHADKVVLAFGHFAPRDPQVATPEFYRSERYVRDPWAPGALARVAPDEPALLVGAGLTAVDVALTLSRVPRSAPLYTLSRRGLLPQPHREHAGALGAAAQQALLQAMGGTARSYLRAVREAVQSHLATGGDWRDVVAALRAHTPALWHRLGPGERRRFLRSLQPHWEIVRHRCAPQAFERFEALRAAGLLRHLAGRVRAYDESEHHVDVTVLPRGGGEPVHLRVGQVVNCTGPNADMQVVDDPLVKHLLGDGLVRTDPLRLGLEVDERHAVVDARGQASGVLHYIGPLLRARDWEATAVPELRVHARALAGLLLAGRR